MFNKRESGPEEVETPRPDTQSRGTVERTVPPAPKGDGAVIGASIHIDGTLKGNEDLLIQGTVKGTVELRNNSVTIGESGQVTADIFAHTISVEGQLEGKLVAAELVTIRKTARIKGTIISPRVTLEDGAHFNGSIDMDPETKALKTPPAASSDKPSGSGAQTPALSGDSGKSSKSLL